MNLGIVGGIAAILAFVPYIYSIFKEKTKPSRMSWFIWSWLGFLLYFSYKSSGAHDTLWIPLVYAIVPLIIFILSFWFGVTGLDPFDILCLLGSLIGVSLWVITKSPKLALVSFIISDVFGTLPTIKKTYLHPEQENKAAWSIMVSANIINVFAVERLDFWLIFYPAYCILCGSSILALTFRKI